MTRLNLAVAVALLAIVCGATAKSKCSPNEGNCEKCNKNRTKCVKCFETYGVNSKGACVQCMPPGKLGWTCVECNGDKPGFCNKCEDWEGEQPTGVYATIYGRCRYCQDKNCYRCASKTGNCKECFRGWGLVGKKCVKCQDDNCITCNKNVKKCTLCYTGYKPNKAGKCVKCTGPGCE